VDTPRNQGISHFFSFYNRLAQKTLVFKDMFLKKKNDWTDNTTKLKGKKFFSLNNTLCHVLIVDISLYSFPFLLGYFEYYASFP
jgi:hypothetical protein